MLRTEKMKEPGEGVELNRWGRYKANLNQCELKWRDHVHSPLMHRWGSNQPAAGSNTINTTNWTCSGSNTTNWTCSGSKTTNWTCSGALCRGRARAPAVVEGEPRSDKAEEQVGEGSSRSTLAWGEADREPAGKVLRGGARMRGMIKGGCC